MNFRVDPTDSAPKEPVIPTNEIELRDYHGVYECAVEMFKQRNITRQSDNLRAFTGILNVLTSSQGDAAIWGFPESIFSYCLGWFMIGTHKRNYANTVVVSVDGEARDVPFPSWSWTAWCGPKNGANNSWLLLMFRPAVKQPWNYVKPKVKFYHFDARGRRKAVNEQWEQPHSPEFRGRQQLRSAWKGEDRLAMQASGEYPNLLFNTIGLVQFWSSVAILQLCQTRLKYKWDPSPSFKRLFEFRVSVWLGDVSHLPRVDIGLASENFEAEDPDATDEAIEVDFVITHRKLGGEFDSSSSWLLWWSGLTVFHIDSARLN